MEKMSINFLGTGNAVPTKIRNHTAILVSFNNESILFDCGEGTQRQYRYAELSPSKLTKLFITHWHGDHILGIPGLLQTLAMQDYQKTLDIYGPRGTANNMQLLSELFKDFKINYKIHELDSNIIENKLWKIESLQMSHGIACNGYSITIKDRTHLDKKKLKKYKLPNSPLLRDLVQGKDIKHNGKLIKAKSICYTEKGKKITIIMDTGMNENAIRLAKDSDILIIESTFSNEETEQAKEYHHLTASQAATIAKKAGVKKLILTHISQRYEHNTKLIEKEAKKIFKNTTIAKDLDKIII